MSRYRPERVAAVAAGPLLMLAARGVLLLRGTPALEKQDLLVWKLAASVAVLALAAAGLRAAQRIGRARADDLLVLAASLSVAVWCNLGLLHGRHITHHWEQFHHFLGSRYFAELGYDGLYAASLGDHADHAPDGWVPKYTRDLRTNQILPSSELVPQMREVYARFTPERWSAFTRDHAFFLEWNSFGNLARFRTDHGYNASPTWTFLAQCIGRWGPASLGWMIALACLDLLLLGLTFTLLFRSFGLRTGCLALALFGTGFLPEFEFVGASFLRFDWLAAVAIALCMLERRRPAAAGALLGYATAIRVFPALFLLGPAVVAVRALRRGERPRFALPLCAGFAASLLLCVGAGSLAGRGVQAWPEFAREIRAHSALWFNNNVGLENVLLYDWDVLSGRDVDYDAPEPWAVESQTIAARKHERGALLIAARAAFLLLLVAALWRASLVEATAACMVAIFALLSPANYYWGMLALVAVRQRTGVALALLFATGVLARAVAWIEPAYEMRYGTQSWALALIFLAWVLPDALATLRSAWARVSDFGTSARASRPAQP